MLGIREALAPVLRDVASTTDLVVLVEDGDWTDLGPSAYVGTLDHGQTGVYYSEGMPDHEAIAALTNQIQEIVVESIGGRASNWPICPDHPSAHPMEAVVLERETWWTCPSNGASVVRVGDLRL